MKKIAIVIGFVLVIGVTFFFVYGHHGASTIPMQNAVMDPSIMQSMNVEHATSSIRVIERWRSRIRAVGDTAAYGEFANEITSLDPATQHMHAHIFGAALYAEKGSDGFPTCGALYSYGCAHALIAAAIQQEGVGVVSKFADACRKTAWPPMCLHGIGHGLVRTSDHTKKAISNVIDLCLNKVHDTSTAGCIGGAVMEYDGQTMMVGLGVQRPLVHGEEYEPCLSAPDAAKSACYLWIVSWWYDDMAAKGISREESFKRVGAMCAKLPESEFMPQCLAGEGEMVATEAGYDGAIARDLCDASSLEPLSRLYCKAYAANIILASPKGEEALKILCTSVRETERTKCVYLSRQGVSVFD